MPDTATDTATAVRRGTLLLVSLVLAAGALVAVPPVVAGPGTGSLAPVRRPAAGSAGTGSATPPPS